MAIVPTVCPIEGVPPALVTHLLELLFAHPDSPVWQLPAWNRMLSRAGGQSQGWYVGIHEEAGVRAYALVEERSLGLGQRAGFALGGPVGSDLPEVARALARELESLARREKWLFVQCEPLRDIALEGFSENSYKRFIEPYTVRIDLAAEPEDILARMHQKGRYNVRLAERSGVTVESVPATDGALDAFYALFRETTARDGFHGNSREYFASLLSMLAETDCGELRCAYADGKLAAAGIFVYFGNAALYYYGASSGDPELRKKMPMYLLQWSAILEARSRGCRTYDLLGIEPPEGGDGHLAGVTEFKKKLAPDVTAWPAARMLVTRPGAYAVFRMIRRIRGAFKKK